MSYAHIWNPVDRDVRQVAEMYSFILFFEVIEKKNVDSCEIQWKVTLSFHLDKNKYIKVVAKSCTVTLTVKYTKLPFSQLSFL